MTEGTQFLLSFGVDDPDDLVQHAATGVAAVARDQLVTITWLPDKGTASDQRSRLGLFLFIQSGFLE